MKNEPSAEADAAQTSRRSYVILACIVVAALLLRVFVPVSAGLAAKDWSLLILFAAALAGLIAQPLPIGVIVLLALTAGTLLGIITIDQALSGFSNSVLWLIITAFMFARAFVKTGLGKRIALHFIQRLGKSSLQLGYSIALTDLVLSPVTASNTARTGGIMFPIVRSLSREFQSEPGDSSRKIGSYLLYTALQSDVVTSALFLTSMAANPLAAELARQVTGVNITWVSWIVASCLPGALSFLAVPYFIYRVYPPELKKTPEATNYAATELKKLGPMTRAEKVLITVFVLLAVVWATSQWNKVSTVAAGLAALCVLMLADALSWDDIIGERPAWNTLIWFGGMLSLATALNKSGVVVWFTEMMRHQFSGSGPITALVIIIIVYVYAHYGFAGMTAQVIALYSAFLSIAVAAGSPPLLAALLLCFFSNLNASLTYYGDGASPIYYQSGYIKEKVWWQVGFLLSVLHLVIWLAVGLPWWKFLKIW